MQLAGTKKLITLFDVLIVVAACLLITAALFDLRDIGALSLVALVVCLLRRIVGQDALDGHKPNLLDLSVLAVALVELLVYLTSSYKENSFHALFESLFLYSFYYMVRFCFSRALQATALYTFLALAALGLAAWVFYNFISQYQSFRAFGLSELTSFRPLIYLGGPETTPTGEWITRFVLLLPFSLILYLKFEKSAWRGPLMWCATVATCLAALLSFSRGVYIALFAFLAITSGLMLFYKTDSLRKVLLINMIILAPVAIALTPVSESALTTVAMFKTTSQVRSYEGRTGLWRQSLDIVKAFPIFGVGSYNFPLHDVSYRGEADERIHTGRVFNFFLQVLIEKGGVGLFAYGLLFYAFFKVTLSKISASADLFEKRLLIILFAACAAAVIRDLSYSSLLVSKGSAILLWLIFADAARRSASLAPPAGESISRPRLYHIAALATVVLFACTIWKDQSRVKAESLFREFTAQVKGEQYPEAESSIAAATRLRPGNAQFYANQALLHVRRLRGKFHISGLLEQKAEFNGDDLEEINQAISSLQKALALCPNDDSYHHNLGWLFFSLKQPEEASSCFQKAVALDPANELYHISLGLFHEAQGQKEEALNQYLAALKLSPGIVDSKFFMDLQERFPARTKDLIEGAILRLEAQLRGSNSPIVRAKLGKLYLYGGMPEQAMSMLGQASKELPGLPLVWFNLGLAFERREAYEQMVKYYNLSALMDSRGVSPWLRLGDYYYRMYEQSAWKTAFAATWLDNALACYKRGVENWLDDSSSHAERVLMLYRSAYGPNDDVIPTGFLHYLGPHIDTAKLSLRLSEFYKQRGEMELARRFEEVGRQTFY
jgi:tetratricopeptide (TPR) repeat protein